MLIRTMMDLTSRRAVFLGFALFAAGTAMSGDVSAQAVSGSGDAAVMQLPPATLSFGAAALPRPGLSENVFSGAGTCPRGPHLDTSNSGLVAGAGSAGAVYGRAYGENRGGAPGSTIDQSSAVLGTSCGSFGAN